MLRLYLRPRAGRVAWLAVLLFGGIGLQLANPQIIRYFLDATQSQANDASLVLAAGLFLAFALGQQALGLASTTIGEQVAWAATNGIRRDLTLHCLRLDLDFHKTHTPGEMIDRIDGDASALGGFFSQMLLRLAANGLLILGILALLFAEDWRVGLALAVYTALTLLLLAAVQPRAVRGWTVARQASTELFSYLEERLGGAEDLRAAGAIPYALYRLLVLLRAALLAERAAFVVSTVIHNFANVLTVAGYAFGLGLAVYLYNQGSASIGTAYLIVAYAGMMAAPLQELRQQLREWQPAAASLQRLGELFALRPTLHAPSVPSSGGHPIAATYTNPGRVDRPPSASLRTAAPASIAFDGVTFNYAGDEAVLHDLTFNVAPGRVLGILGRTGSGKSTLTRLLFRLYDPTAGRILVDGQDLRQRSLSELRARVGLVTQDVQLFGATVRDNLTLFNPAYPDDALLAALQALGLHEWLQRLPNGLNTRLAAGGEGLSAGEAQLLALARVLLKDPGLVVLDEASSRLDPATEHRLELALDRLFAGRTALVIAHRLRTIERADDLLILEAGRVVEFGPRTALAADPCSRFAALLRAGLEETLA
jgi:ABC-type multidrug transport system fused ATPase/permease subunit